MSICKPALVMAALAAVPSTAQEVTFSIRGTEACLASVADFDGLRSCVGTSAFECMNASDMGATTIGASACLAAERDWWDARLNAAYKRLMASKRTQDAEFPPPKGVAGQAEALREMQRAWIRYRDAACEFELSQWMGGSGGGPAHVGCMMRLTGEQAIFLENAGAEG